jgi:cytochrome c heme-lyase
MSDSSNTDASAGRCPVDHGKKSGECPVDHKGAGATSSLWKVLGIQSAAASPDPKETSSAQIPASLEEAAKHAQTPHAEQRLPLREWESDDVELVRFQGRPNTLSPKAWFLSTFLFQEKPFDRHDWFIDNGVQHEKRFVLDFYMQESKQTGLPRVEVDVRPALDSPQAFVDRAQRIALDLFPGISTALQQWQAPSNRSSPPPPSPRPNADQS